MIADETKGNFFIFMILLSVLIVGFSTKANYEIDSGLNPSDSKFAEIADYISGVVEIEDYRQWNEEIADYIFKMNPN